VRITPSTREISAANASSGSASRPALSSQARVAICLLLTLAASYLVYAETTRFGFAYDDFLQIVYNARVHSPQFLGDYFKHDVWAQAQDRPGNLYRPLFLTWLLANYELFRLDSTGWHFTAILAHPEYQGLRETPYLLCPTKPETYRLLDDLYREVAPQLPFPYFNVCCDETDGLGQGPSVAMQVPHPAPPQLGRADPLRYQQWPRSREGRVSPYYSRYPLAHWRMSAKLTAVHCVL